MMTTLYFLRRRSIPQATRSGAERFVFSFKVAKRLSAARPREAGSPVDDDGILVVARRSP